MRTIALLVAASLAWSASALADPEAPASALPALPSAPPAPSSAPAADAPAPPEPTRPAPAAPPAPPDAASDVETAPLALTPIHHGFYLRATSGFGGVNVSGSAPGGGSASVSGFGNLASFAIGGSPAPGFAIGFVFDGGMASGTFIGGPQIVATTTYTGPLGSTTETLSGNAKATSGVLGGFVDWFPNPHHGWHVGASVGIGVSSIEDDAHHQLASVGLGLGASGGYVWWIAKALSAGLTASVLGSLPGQANDSHGDDTGYRLGSVAFGLSGELLYY